MRFKLYNTFDGGTDVISLYDSYAEIRELGHVFAVALAERGHRTKDSDLMNGLAAYHLLKLEGESARLDAAHGMVMKDITDEMFKRTQEVVSEIVSETKK
jgi:hypothetical protein